MNPRTSNALCGLHLDDHGTAHKDPALPQYWGEVVTPNQISDVVVTHRRVRNRTTQRQSCRRRLEYTGGSFETLLVTSNRLNKEPSVPFLLAII